MLAAVAVPWMVACGDDASSDTSGTDAGTDSAKPTPTGTSTGTVLPSTCVDSTKGGSESDVDCGGTCPKCVDGKACTTAGDCSSGVCTNKVCAAPSCTDTVKNAAETDVDCGGACSTKCEDGKACSVPADCSSNLCGSDKKCMAVTCTDTLKNGTETDVDCGGTCGKCADTKTCAVAADCASSVCDSATKKCSVPACNDLAKNGTETDVDCGGTCATKCAATKKCAVAADCATGVCDAVAKTCTAAKCDDTVLNGTESDVDCGGSCATKCVAGKKCVSGADCATSFCSASLCAVPKSCLDIKTSNAAAADGVYTIDPDGAGAGAPYSAYCDMTKDGGGWTLVIKADGAQPTFTYDAALWTDNSTFGTATFDAVEGKLQPFNDVGFTNVRVSLVDGGVTRSAIVPQASASLSALFIPPAYLASAIGRDAWKGLLAAPSLQSNCNMEGFNSNPVGGTRVRIGIVSNQENDCGSPDSWIGIGGIVTVCAAGNSAISVGDVGCYAPDNGDVATPAFGYVFVR